jgi:transcriptional regulator GlxA family with amidase domain
MTKIINGSNPLNVGILIFDAADVLDFCGAYEVFSLAGRLICNTNYQDYGESATNVFTVAQSDQIIKARGGLAVKPDYTFDNHPEIEVLVVPGGWGSRHQAENPVLLDWLKRVSKQTWVNASVCTGAFLLGKAGLLEGRRATTHWRSLDRLGATFPNTIVVRDLKWVDEGEVITSAGISAGIDMSLHLLERLFNREVALITARQMEYQWNEN